MAKVLPCRTGLPVTLALVVTVGALAGCATAPSGGAPRPAPGGSSQVQAYVQPLPPLGPTDRWGPTEVVLGFLHASASYAFDPAAARKYLGPALRTQWHPDREPVAVLGPTGATVVKDYPQRLAPSVAGGEVVVKFTGQHLATLSQSGQYEYLPGQNVEYDFVLAKTSNVWLIQQLPKQQALMLTESDFEDVYQPRNLFFFAPAAPSAAPDVLVPDPVYAPLQSSNSALNTDVATRLVSGLLRGQGGWLAGASYSAFPAGTRLLKKVTITGKTAHVDLGGAAGRTQPQVRQQMFDQLLATLSDGAYSAPLAWHVQLSINNVPVYALPANLVATVPSGPIQLITGPGAVGQLRLGAVPQPRAKAQPSLGPQQIGPAVVTAVAASPGDAHPEQLAVAVENDGGCAIEDRPGGQDAYKRYPVSGDGGACTSLSYDANGNLWAAAGHRAWSQRPGRSPVSVALPSSVTQPGDQILALRMAPDAVRVALLVKTPDGNRLLLAAVRFTGGGVFIGQPVTIGAGLTDTPLAISWYDAYHLAVLTSAGPGTTGGIYSVPLTGGIGQQPAPQLISTAPFGARTLTTDGSELVAGTQGEIFAGTTSSPVLQPVATGADPVYPG